MCCGPEREASTERMAGSRNWFQWLVHYACQLVYMVARPIFRWLYDCAHRGLPPVSDPLLMMSAVELAAKIRKKQVTSVEVVTSFISRIRQVNPYVNAVVANRFEDALKEAAEVDRILSGDNGLPDSFSEINAPFLGVPMTTKESIFVAGLPNTAGLMARVGVRSECDGDVIALMRKAGAIPLAVTNISELCMWLESSNNVYGRTNNAYHQGRMVGGSSGGEGCIQSAAASPIGIGSDIGGSIRLPAFFNGIFGHKPTAGVVNNRGQFPAPKGEADTYLGKGPMCRYAVDLLPIFKVLVRPEHRDRLRLDDEVDFRNLKYYYMEDDGGGQLITPVCPSIKATLNTAIDHFKSLNCPVKRISLSGMRMSFPMWSSLMATSGNDPFCSRLASGTPNSQVNPYTELVSWLIGRSQHTLPSICLGLTEKVHSPPEKHKALREVRDTLLRELDDVLGNDGVFLYPVFPHPAPFHNEALLSPLNFAYCGVFNVLGLPATAVPMGLSQAERLPVGFQVVASQYQDRLTLAVAVELERAFGGWVPPFQVNC